MTRGFTLQTTRLAQRGGFDTPHGSMCCFILSSNRWVCRTLSAIVFHLGLAKAPALNDKKCPHIFNMGAFFIVELWEFSLYRNPILDVEWGYNRPNSLYSMVQI